MEIYYAFWAQIREWPVYGRAAIVMGISFLILYICLKVAGVKVKGILLGMCLLLVKGGYSLISLLASVLMAIQNSAKSIERWNRFTEKTESILNKIEKERANKRQRITFGKTVSVYMILLLLIALPDLMGKVVNPKYISAFSGVQKLYLKAEKNSLEKSKDYEAFFVLPVKDERQKSPVKLSLSERGIRGANIRTEPNPKSKIVTEVSGNIQLLYISKENGWIYVRLPDNQEGWIREYLVNGLPE